ncbi:MAG: glycosyltransferase, partial [Planctomycetota bacterium]
SPLHVRFAGHRTDVAQLLPHASQFWVGSAYEGQSNALMEAMQAGLPVVASDIPGNRDLITHETHGLLFPLGDRVAMAKRSQRLLEDPALAQHLASAARERIETEFTIQQMVEKHATLYSGLQEETPVV